MSRIWPRADAGEVAGKREVPLTTRISAVAKATRWRLGKKNRNRRPARFRWRGCTAPSRCRRRRPGSGGSGGRSSARRSSSASATWTRATGAPTSPGGAQFRYGLLWVVGLASLMAIFLQVIAARLGVATGKDLAQCCRDWYPGWTRWPNWIAMEIAIGATDLAESLGSAVALNLLFRIPMPWAVIITAFDVLLLLALQGLGMRLIEAVVTVFVADDRRLLRHRDLRAAADAARLPGDGPRAGRAPTSRERACSSSPSASSGRR